MLQTAIILSLQITAIYVLFLPNCFLGWLRSWVANILDKMFGKVASIYIQKPLWECLFCMSSVWTIILTRSFNLPLMLCVCGINFLIDKVANYERGIGE